MFGASLLSMAVFFGFIFWIVGLFASAFSDITPAVPKGSVLVINLDENIVDSPRAPEFLIDGGSDFALLSSLSMLDVITAVESAVVDPAISAIYINTTGVGSIEGLSQMEELRRLLEAFKESCDKPIVAYQEVYSQGDYWLSSVADEIYLNPAGSLDWRGVASQSIFFKGAIEKLGVDVQVVRHGTFKAAVEPFLLSEMSTENRLQTKTMIDAVWGVMLEGVSSSRNIPKESLGEWASNLEVTSAKRAVELGMVDGALYEDEVKARIAELVNNKEPNYISLGEYSQLLPPMPYSKNRIAIIYADGEIVDGEGGESIVGSITTCEQIRRAREDKGVKAVVLRVNSPGGSALASEVMWRELELLKKEKPLVVSMSNYAASGGYYISSPGCAVLTNRTTLTGSIGVFGVIVSGGEALKEGLGVTADVVKSNPHADMGNIFRPLSKKELAYMQASVEDVYDTFVERVAGGREMTQEAVRTVGEGRVWVGESSVELGLTDGIGGLREAILSAAVLAGVESDYCLVEVLEAEDDILTTLTSLMMARSPQLELVTEELEMLHNALEEGNGIYARMPYNVSIY